MYICYGYVLDTYPYIYTIVKNTNDSNSLQFDLKYLMLRFVLSIKVPFVLVGAGRMHRRYPATVKKVENIPVVTGSLDFLQHKMLLPFWLPDFNLRRTNKLKFVSECGVRKFNLT